MRKIITFDAEEKLPEQKKLELIDSISRATNSQTVVSKADRRSNEADLKRLQQRCFETFGIWLERKRGEFMDGIREGYLKPSLVIDRNFFMRAIAIARKDLKQATKKRIFADGNFSLYVDVNEEEFRKYFLSLKVLRGIHEGGEELRQRIRWRVVSKAYIAMILLAERTKAGEPTGGVVAQCVSLVNKHWKEFIGYLGTKYTADRYWHKDKDGGREFNVNNYLLSREVEIGTDVHAFFERSDMVGSERHQPPVDRLGST